MELNVSFQVSPSLLSKNPVKSTFSGFYFLKFCTNGQTYFGGVKGFFTNPLTKILTTNKSYKLDSSMRDFTLQHIHFINPLVKILILFFLDSSIELRYTRFITWSVFHPPIAIMSASGMFFECA